VLFCCTKIRQKNKKKKKKNDDHGRNGITNLSPPFIYIDTQKTLHRKLKHRRCRIMVGNDRILLSNCRIHNDKGVLQPAFVVIDSHSGKIQTISTDKSVLCSSIADNGLSFDVVECEGNILAPGFIDIQINGAHGVDFSSPNLTKDDVKKVSRLLPQYGVTSFCPTIISSSEDVYSRNIAIISGLCCRKEDEDHDNNGNDDDSTKRIKGASILGLHLEGPFFASSKRGAHDEAFILEEVSMSLISSTYSSQDLHGDHIKIITMAPELSGALTTIQSLSSDVIISMGHTNATYDDGKDAIKAGATLITHLFNAMKPFHHRDPGLFGLISSSDKNEDGNNSGSPYFSIIVDGQHSHPESVKMAYSLSPSKLILITDAMSAMGLGTGTHSLGSMTVSVDRDKATLLNTDTLAGSVLSMDACVRNLISFTGCRMNEAIAAATINPAKLLRLEHNIGSLRVGLNADLILLNDELNVIKTWIGGRLLYDNSLNFT